MKTHQSTLSSFFFGTASKKPPATNNKKSKESKNQTKEEIQKQSKENKLEGADHHLVDTDDETSVEENKQLLEKRNNNNNNTETTQSVVSDKLYLEKKQKEGLVDTDSDDDDDDEKSSPTTGAEKRKMEAEDESSSLQNQTMEEKPAKKKKQKIEKKKKKILLIEKEKEELSDELKTLAKELEFEGESVLSYASLALLLTRIEAISGRLEIQKLVTGLFRLILSQSGDEQLAKENLTNAVYLLSNSVAPAYKCVELGIGESLLIKALAEATGRTASHLKKQLQSTGDLGDIAQTCAKTQSKLTSTFFVQKKPSPKNNNKLKASEVLSTFRSIAQTSGSQAQKWKVDQIKKLLVKVENGVEAKFITRGLQGKLRVGLAESTVLVCLGHAIWHEAQNYEFKTKDRRELVHLPESAKMLYQHSKKKSLSLQEQLECAVNVTKKAYSEFPSYDELVGSMCSVPLYDLHKACTLTPGIPVAPMLAKPTKSVQEVLKRLNGVRFTCEYKYDGERAQIHMKEGGETKVFSRNLLETTQKYLEAPRYVKEACQEGVTSYVLDTEVVAYNQKTNQLVPFQILSTRKKALENEEEATVKIIVQAFDLMYLNGQSLLNNTLAERRELMMKHFKPVEGKFRFATSLDHKEDGDTTVLEEFLDAAVKGQCEGLMVKTLDDNAMYEPSRRSLNWLKLKKDYLEGLGDSVDLVPIGAFHGKGKRTGVYGAYLLACYDEDSEEFQSVCKVGTGFSDEDLKSLAEGLKEHIISEKSSQFIVSDAMQCDVWFDAAQVWEVKAADLSKSSMHKGAIDRTGEEDRGIGLRFPRFERLREDKKPEQATSSSQILEMYYAQDSVNGGSGAMDDDDGI